MRLVGKLGRLERVEAGQARKLPRSGFVHLAKNAGSSILNSVTDIIFLAKMQKGKPPKKDLPLLKLRYHKNSNALIFKCSLQFSKVLSP